MGDKIQVYRKSLRNTPVRTQQDHCYSAHTVESHREAIHIHASSDLRGKKIASFSPSTQVTPSLEGLKDHNNCLIAFQVFLCLSPK